MLAFVFFVPQNKRQQRLSAARCCAKSHIQFKVLIPLLKMDSIARRLSVLGGIMSRLVALFAAAVLAASPLTAQAGVHDAYREGVREVSKAKIDGVREVAAERREAARDFYEADSPRERRQAIREGAREVRAAKRSAVREVRSERREARRDIRQEVRENRWK